MTATFDGIHMIAQYANHRNRARAAEYDHCILANLNNPHVAAVYDLIEPDTQLPQDIRDHPKHIAIPHPRWITFADAFDFAGEKLSGQVVAIVNLDIFLDPGSPWPSVVPLLDRGVVLCQGRHEYANGAPPRIDPTWERKALANAQDAWVFKAPLRPDDCDFEIGTLGCDNAVAERIARIGRTPLNWAELFKVVHFDVARGKVGNETRDFHAENSPARPTLQYPEERGQLLLPMFHSATGIEKHPQLMTTSPTILDKLLHEIANYRAGCRDMTTRFPLKNR